jgi:hypothetical protein
MQILGTISIILAAIFALATLAISVFLRIQDTYNGKSVTQDDLDALHTVEAQVQTALFAIVTDLERSYGSGTGELKLAAGVQKVVSLLPESLRKCVTTDTIVDWIENALADAKQKWAKNAALVDVSLPSTLEVAAWHVGKNSDPIE